MQKVSKAWSLPSNCWLSFHRLHWTLLLLLFISTSHFSGTFPLRLWVLRMMWKRRKEWEMHVLDESIGLLSLLPHFHAVIPTSEYHVWFTHELWKEPSFVLHYRSHLYFYNRNCCSVLFTSQHPPLLPIRSYWAILKTLLWGLFIFTFTT